MDLVTLFILAVGLSMDAFAVSICKGLATQKYKFKNSLIVGVWFGGFQALMPTLGYFMGSFFADAVSAIAPYIAFILLAIIGGNMIRESCSKEEEDTTGTFAFKEMLLMAIATSIDAFAIGVSFAFLEVNIVWAASFIGVTTFLISGAGLAVGCYFGAKYKEKAERAGGIVLIVLGLKILLEHLSEKFLGITIDGKMYFRLFLLVIGFVLLIKGADVFVEAAAKVAAKLKIPAIIIGLTVVAFGTSAPEAAISITAGIKGSSAIAVGNVLGSNVINVLLILGIASIITPLALQKTTLYAEIPYVLLLSVIFLFLGKRGWEIGRIDGIILLGLMVLFLVYLVVITKKGLAQSDDPVELTEKDTVGRLILFLLLSGACIVGGSQLTVNSATYLARSFGVSERIIGLTLIAFGTSLPELITSVTAARKKQADIAIGNIVGSNLFNLLFVIGVAALIRPVTYVRENISDNIMAAVVMGMLFAFSCREHKLKKWGGIIFLLAYAGYFVYLCIGG